MSSFKLGERERTAAVAAFISAVNAPGKYDEATKATGHALPVSLMGGGTFWSKGWRGCEWSYAHRADDWQVPLQPFLIREPDGRLRSGWACCPAATQVD